MARPKKATELKRSHPIMLRLTDTEYEIISENAKVRSSSLGRICPQAGYGKASKNQI